MLKKNLRRATGNGLAEFPLALMILFVMLIVPLINLLGLGLGIAAIGIIAMQSVSAAAAQPSYPTALAAMTQEALALQGTPLMHFLNLQPVGGNQNCGLDLYIKADNFRDGSTATFGPNTPVPPPVDVTTNVYEFCAHTQFNVSPWINMSGIPFVSTVPGLGQPVLFSLDQCRAIEAPALLEGTTVAQGTGTVGSQPPPTIAVTPLPITPTQGVGDWNYPNIYQLIAATGETVVATDILTVMANNPNWTISAAYAAAGDNVWIDTSASGSWVGTDTPATFGPNGYMPVGSDGLPQGCLEGRVGANGTIYFTGASQLNFTPPNGNGDVEFRFDDQSGNYSQNTGEVVVRVIVTQRG